MRASDPPDLLERATELDALAARIAAARDGAGALVLVEGPAGVGKTALLRAARGHAADQGLRVQHAVGGELERDFPFGLVRQLLEPVVLAEGRTDLLAGAAAHAGPVLGAAPDPHAAAAEATFATLHGLYWLVAALADEAPLLLCVDDVQWSDAASLRFLDFLARRAPELPVLVLAGLRPAEPGTDRALLDGLAEVPGAEVVRPRPLTDAATRALVVGALGPDVAADVAAAAHAATDGNPFLLRELLRTLAADAAPPTAAAIDAAVPASVARSVTRRLGRLPDAAATVARALAVLGDRHRRPPLEQVTGLEPLALAAALQALADAGLVEGAPPRFVHPLVREAVASGVDAVAADGLHRRAAAALRGQAGREDEVALHLLATAPGAEAWVRAVLRASAADALAAGAPDAAVRRLERALDEQPGEDERAALLLELGTAELHAARPGALDRFAAAAQAADPAVASRAEEARAAVLGVLGAEQAGALAAALRRALEHAEGERAAHLRAELLAALAMSPDLVAEREAAIAGATDEPPVLRAIAWLQANAGAPASHVRETAARGLAGRPFQALDTLGRSSSWYAIFALIWAGDDAGAAAAIDDAQATARRHASRLGAAYAAAVRGYWELAFGSAVLAEAAVRDALGLFAAMGLDEPLRIAGVVLADALLLQGRLDAAEAALDALPADLDRDFSGWDRRLARARLLLARGRAADAVADLEALRALTAARGWPLYAYGSGPELVSALAAAGRVEEALAVAGAELATVRAGERRIAEAQLLTAQGRLRGDVETLTTAVAIAEATPSMLAQAGALLELGATLRRDGRRVDARDPLRRARDLAHRSGAAVLEQRATEELVIAGGRPRRVALSGVEALTPSERRVAEHAARGLTNRQIAETLFVTRKTVEFQLGAAFAKLGITSRRQLADVLSR